MCLSSSPLIARGTGTEIEKAGGLPVLDLVLVNPGVAVSTPEVFKALKQKQNPPLAALPARSDAAELINWLAQQRNDLQPPAITLAPAIDGVLSALERSGAILQRMSGSGATCFGIFAGSSQAQQAAAAIAAAQSGWWVTATQTRDFGMDRVHIHR